MTEPFKNVYNHKLIMLMSGHFSKASPDFDEAGFVQIAADNLDMLEFKARASQICNALEYGLPQDFRSACRVILQTLHPNTLFDLSDMSSNSEGIRGWALMPVGEYIARHGVDDFDYSMGVLKEITKRSSAEFDVRTFILADTERALDHIAQWALDDNYHVRRLASEGSRPRLPWAFQLRPFIADPSQILPILEILKDDSHEYVRRSVANSLNDIAKDHPDLVASLMKEWMEDASVARKKLIRHALRTLIKAGHPDALTALGYGTPEVDVSNFRIITPTVYLGNALEFSVDIKSLSTIDQPLIIDYVVHHMRAHGKTSPKVFKWKNIKLNASERLSNTRRHVIKLISTRRYYAGRHRVELLINGVNYKGGEFALILE